MKKKPLTTYPSIPAPRVDQFTLPELISQLFRSKQFTSGVQNILSNCIVTQKSAQISSFVAGSSNSVHTLLNSPKTVSNKKAKKQPITSTSRQNTESSLLQLTSEDECEFIFENQVRNRMLYPWMLGENGGDDIVQCKLITDQITEFIQDAIECSLHKILNKEFINVTNEILAMREQINVFTKEELERTDNIKTELKRQLEKMQKKIQQQQHISTSILNQPLEKFSRSKGVLNNSLSSTKQSAKFVEEDNSKTTSIHHQVFALRKEVDNIKKSLSSNPQSQKSVSSDVIKQMEEKLFTNEEKLNELTLNLKLSLQEHKQKWKKSHEKLSSQLAMSTSKQYLTKQVKKTVQSNLKIYLDEIMKCKKNIQDLYDRLERNDKGIQDYIGNQLKNVWTLVSGIKTRVEHIEDQCNVGLDQSFIL